MIGVQLTRRETLIIGFLGIAKSSPARSSHHKISTPDRTTSKYQLRPTAHCDKINREPVTPFVGIHDFRHPHRPTHLHLHDAVNEGFASKYPRRRIPFQCSRRVRSRQSWRTKELECGQRGVGRPSSLDRIGFRYPR
jgi:hypothetical protein